MRTHEFPNSSNISKITWNEGVMDVYFVKGTCYRAEGVPEDLIDKMIVSPSAGSFFAKELKTRFAFKRH